MRKIDSSDSIYDFVDIEISFKFEEFIDFVQLLCSNTKKYTINIQ